MRRRNLLKLAVASALTTKLLEADLNNIIPIANATSPSGNLITASVNWNAVSKKVPNLQFGLNAYQGFRPQNFNNSAYSSNMAYMNPGFIRFHNLGSLSNSTNDDGLISTANMTVSNSTAGYKSYLIVNRGDSSKQIQTNFNGWTPVQTALDEYQVSSLGYTHQTIDWNSFSTNNYVVPEYSVTVLSFKA